MSKSKQIALRISVEDHDLVKELGGNFTEIWCLGFEKWCHEYPDLLQKKSQEYKDMYIQCIAKLGKIYTSSVQKSGVLGDLYTIYVSTGRSVLNPTAEDRSWVKARLSKAENGNRMSVAQFFEFAQKKYQFDKQKKLEVEE
ncbi:hypothetical protein CCP3SC1AL1_2430003 [Gammaproteobacteria bacterium]